MKTQQEHIICDVTQDLSRILYDLGQSSYSGVFKLEFNFHKGDISKKVKHGTVETIIYDK